MRWIDNWSNWGRQLPLARRPRPRAFFEQEAKPTDGDDVPPRGCAWFDSSHELRAGLFVRELSPGPELQLMLWLAPAQASAPA